MRLANKVIVVTGGLVNNAGVMDRFQAVGSVDDEIWTRVMGVNLNGPMYASRRAVQLMLQCDGGSIVNISSFAGSSGALIPVDGGLRAF